MPPLSPEKVGLAFDMCGCPNRCRHCYLGDLPDDHVCESEVRSVSSRFRNYRRSESKSPFFKKLAILPWLREPDYSDNYRDLHELAQELSDPKATRFELLSIWRLAHDQSYADWAKSVGPDTCQITFFGEEETTDWFFRRKGAFRDNLVATERLLEVGMKPRWQIFATSRGIPEFDKLLKRVDLMRLPQRVEALGGEFVIFMHTPGPDGRALQIEHLRPDIEAMRKAPQRLLESSRKHFKKQTLYYSEAELCEQLLCTEPQFPYAIWHADMPWFLVTGQLDVFSNMQGMDPWWKLGNLKTDELEAILRRFEDNDTLGWRTIHTVSPKELVQQYGCVESSRAYTSTDDLLSLYVTKYSQDHFVSSV